MPQQPITHVIIHRHLMPGEAARSDHAADFCGERTIHALIGVQFQNPIAGAGGDAGIAPITFQFPSTFQHKGTRCAGDCGAGIRGAVQHHHNLICKRCGGEAIGQPRFLIPRDDQDGKLRRHAGTRAAWPISARAASNTRATGKSSIAP